MSAGSPTSSSPPESGQTAVDKLRVIIVGATKEGRDLLELFSRDPSIVLVAIADHDPDAPGLDVAKKLSIPISTDPLALITHAAADLIVDLTGFRGEIRWDSSKPDGQPRRAVDASRARDWFGFQAEVSFEDGLRATIDWYEQSLAGGHHPAT